MFVLSCSVLIFNILWFFTAFYSFTLVPENTCRSFRPDILGKDPRIQLVIPTMKFLGGMNIALCSLNALSLYFIVNKLEVSILLLSFISSGIGHATQFFINIPNLKGLRNGAYWDICSWPMLFVFIMDFLGMMLNLVMVCVVLIKN